MRRGLLTLAALAIVGTVVACSEEPKQRDATEPTAPSSASSSPNLDDADPCATPNKVVTRRSAPESLKDRDRAFGLGPFAGHWVVHGSRMDLRPDGPSEVSSTFNSVGDKGTVETDTVRWTRYRNPDRLLLVVTDVRYEDGTGRPVPEPSDACWLADGSVQRGDASLLRFAAPHLLQGVTLVSHVAPINLEGGNDFWCGEGLAKEYQYHCGA